MTLTQERASPVYRTFFYAFILWMAARGLKGQRPVTPVLAKGKLRLENMRFAQRRTGHRFIVQVSCRYRIKPRGSTRRQ